MYFSPPVRVEKSLCIFPFFKNRLYSKLKKVLFCKVPLQIEVVTGMGDFLDAVIVSH